MVKCPRCGHENLPSFPTCSRCGTGFAGNVGPATHLPHASMGVPQAPADEYANLMASRAASAKRNRSMFGGVFFIALVMGGYFLWKDHQSKGGRQEKLNVFERWAAYEKSETGSFFNCVMASEVDMNLFSNSDQVQQRVESAFFTQQKTFSDHLLTDCVPKIERARQAFGGMRDAPPELAPAMAKYQEVLPQLQAGIEEYAEKIKARQGVKDVDQLIQEMGGVWQSGGGPTPEAVAFEKFLHCGIPGLARMKDTQQMVEFLHDACFKKDPVAFMDRVRKDCGPILSTLSGSSPSKTWKVSQQRFLEEEARQLRAWESCGKKSRKGKKVEDLSTFLTHVGTYLHARTEVVKAARAIAEPGEVAALRTTALFAAIAAAVAAGCASAPGGPPTPTAATRAFRHPGLLNDRQELATLRQRVGTAPWKAVLEQLKSSTFASLDWRPQPRTSVWCGPYSQPDFGCREEKNDATAAYTHALLWVVTGTPAHLTKAIEILDAWAATLEDHGGHNAPLQSAWVASVLARAAELVRHTSSAWSRDHVARFSWLLARAYLPQVAHGMPTYNGNWELSMIEATMAIAVFLDDGPLFDGAVAMWRKRVPAYFYLASDGEHPVPPPGTDRYRNVPALVEKWYGQSKFVDGLSQETCRDFGHTMYGLAAAVNAAEIAHHQGVDLYGEQAQRLTAGMEFHARYLLDEPAPDWLCGGQLKLGRSATFEIAYNHFHNRAGLALPHTETLIRDKVRPSRADHHMVWESFTHGELSRSPAH